MTTDHPRADPATRLLRLAATIDADPARLAQIGAAADAVGRWQDTIRRAESHGIAPLLRKHLQAAGAAIPREADRQLRALTIRHRIANRLRAAVLFEVIAALDEAGIGYAVLKGGALAHLLYAQIGDRPMRDLDILVDRRRLTDARDAIRRLGFDAPERASSRYMRHHHHLPNATLVRAGMTFSLEIHRDALSGDVPARMTLERLLDPPRIVATSSGPMRCLDHIDMLHHLCRHAFEPGMETRLVSVADILGYAARFRDDIDWSRADRLRPIIGNTLTMLHYLSPLPPALERWCPRAPAPTGVGRGMAPLSQILRRRHSVREIVRLLFYPSDWWLKTHYGRPPTSSMALLRFGRHSLAIGLWLLRRMWSLAG